MSHVNRICLEREKERKLVIIISDDASSIAARIYIWTAAPAESINNKVMMSYHQYHASVFAF